MNCNPESREQYRYDYWTFGTFCLMAGTLLSSIGWYFYWMTY